MNDLSAKKENIQETIESLQDQVKRAKVMEEYLLRLAAETDPGRLITLVAELAGGLVHAETLAVPLLSADNLHVHYDFVCGRYRDIFLGMTLPIEEAGLCGWVLENRKPILTNRLMDDPRVKREMAASLGLTASVVVPLISRGRIIGGLSAFNKEDGAPFTERDVESLTHLAGYAAVTIENARLADTLKNEKAKLEAILDAVVDGIVFLSRDGTIINVNKAMEKFIPMKADEMVGANVQDFAQFTALADLFDCRVKAGPGKRCWEIIGCRNEDCPVYNMDILRCWTQSGSHCRKAAQTETGVDQAPEVCVDCEAFRQAGVKLAVPREVRTMGKTVQVTSTLVVEGLANNVFGELLVFHDVSAEKRGESRHTP